MTRCVFVDASNRFHLMPCDVINYDDVISAPDSWELVKNARFIDIQIVKKIVV